MTDKTQTTKGWDIQSLFDRIMPALNSDDYEKYLTATNALQVIKKLLADKIPETQRTISSDDIAWATHILATQKVGCEGAHD